MLTRRVIVTIDTITNLFKDYLGVEHLPEDAKPLSVMINPKERNRLGIMMDSDQWVAGMPPLVVNFHLKRVYAAH